MVELYVTLIQKAHNCWEWQNINKPFFYSFIYNHSNLVNLQCCIRTPWSSFKVRSGLPYLVFKYFRNSHRNINQNILISCFVILYFYFQYQLFVTYYFSAYNTILVLSHPHMQTTQTMKQNITSHFIQPTKKIVEHSAQAPCTKTTEAQRTGFEVAGLEALVVGSCCSWAS